tara:strand:+ start:212 stop:436 length:225 start_codon:yes stop_codon:yes gene_type:complete
MKENVVVSRESFNPKKRRKIWIHKKEQGTKSTKKKTKMVLQTQTPVPLRGKLRRRLCTCRTLRRRRVTCCFLAW